MKWTTIALIVVLALAAVAALAALVGWRLPRAHVASRQRTFPVPPEAVWAAITTVEAFPSWRSDVKKIERLPDRDGRPVWIEDGASGRMTLAVERMEPPRLLVLRIADPDLPFGGTWTYEIAPDPAGMPADHHRERRDLQPAVSIHGAVRVRLRGDDRVLHGGAREEGWARPSADRRAHNRRRV